MRLQRRYVRHQISLCHAKILNVSSTDNGQQPRRLMQARIEFERAWFAATTATVTVARGAAQSLVDLIVATGRLVRELGTNSTKPGVVKIKKGEKTSEREIAPAGDLQRQWAELTAKSDQTSEYHLARAIAGITAWANNRPNVGLHRWLSPFAPTCYLSLDDGETPGLGM